MSEQLGVEMTFLRPTDRSVLMKGMVLRRLPSGSPLLRDQLDVGIGQDVIEIQRRFSTFDFKTYIGCDLDSFYTGMTVAMLINQRDVDGKTIYERGELADEFDKALTDDMEWMIEALPMSTRGFFDKLKSKPEREVTVDKQAFVDAHDKKGNTKRVIVDHSMTAQEQLRTGPIIRP